MKSTYVAALLAGVAYFLTAQPSIGAPTPNASPPVGFTRCVNEGEICAYTGRAWVTFGSGGNWTSPAMKSVVSPGAGVNCTVLTLGDPDAGQTPIATRTCYYMPVGTKWPAMLPLPSGMALLDAPLVTPNSPLCQPVELGGTGPQGLQGMLPEGYAQARWCRSQNGWIGYFVVQDLAYAGPPLEIKWPEAVTGPPPPQPPPPPPIGATWVIAAAPTYPVTFTRLASGTIVWVRSKIAGIGRATVGSTTVPPTLVEGTNQYCRYSPIVNDVALCVSQ